MPRINIVEVSYSANAEFDRRTLIYFVFKSGFLGAESNVFFFQTCEAGHMLLLILTLVANFKKICVSYSQTESCVPL